MFIGGVASINNGSIQNVSVNYVNSGNNYLTDINIKSGSNALYFGGITAQNDGDLFNVYTNGSINILKENRNTSYFIGGLAGLNNKQIDGNTNFFNKAELNDDYNSSMNIIVNQQIDSNNQSALGGLVGINNGDIVNAAFAGYINAYTQNKTTKNTGGIAGISSGKLQNTFSSGQVFGNQNVGGLVGYALGSEQDIALISNSSVNMFDDSELNAKIIGSQNVGGLIGKAEFTVVKNSYARGYKKADKTNFEGDLLVNNDNSEVYVGGVIGFATNTNLEKTYSRIALNAPNFIVGGLIGYANNVNLENTFERNELINSTVWRHCKYFKILLWNKCRRSKPRYTSLRNWWT